MRCPICWAEKAYSRPVEGWRGWLLAWVFIVPMQCHHCFHRFHVSWFQTLGKPLTPPLRIAPSTRGARMSHAAQQPPREENKGAKTPKRRADAA